MKYWGIIKGLVKKTHNKIKSLFSKIKRTFIKLGCTCSRYAKNTYKMYMNYENKKELTGAIVVWFIAFFVVIAICRLNKDSSVAVSANEENEQTAVAPLQTVEHEKIKLGKAELITTEVTSIEEDTTTQPETTHKVEQETININKLNVSQQLLPDDVENTKNKDIVNDSDVKTKSSSQYDSSQFVYGIDISYHQGKIDWAKVKQSGVEYAFIRVGNRGYETGKLCKDARFDENVQGAIANGIKVGVYFFSQAITEEEALEEASLTLSYIKNVKLSLPVVIDWETDQGYRTNCGLSKTQLTNILSKFCDTVASYGYEPMVYMCKDDFFNRIHTQSITSKYKTWVAWYFKKYCSTNYANNMFHYGDELPDMSFEYNIWQYSSKGRINGIKELTDLNIMIVPKKTITYEHRLNITKESFTINIGCDVNLMEGVTASGTQGNDTTSQVKITIKNSVGKEISKTNAIQTSGKYAIQYTSTDSNGNTITKQAVLYVRNYPEIIYEGQLWSDTYSRKIEYNYDHTKTEAENKDQIRNIIQSKMEAFYYKTINSESSKERIYQSDIQGIENIFQKENISGTREYELTYIVNDGMGLSSSKKILLKVTSKKSDEESSDQTKDETTEIK